ncbi:acetyl-CoA synthetase-like protein [Hypoxylon trugodes]|uniref:acetyl-CoA synthetase-like protein n=1 Tax=Hypoxylon trugodes TaxID=326681 RepID=UPI00219D6F15|nr:acetyl-CoA synthetase-like protein [Hypoxylon trugodes]KAI1389370.1 acetyl-CoA synthetase-like protein [Hypoxylon trugodes]
MSNISADVVKERTDRFGKLWMIDDLIRERGRDEEQAPILGYPRYDHDAAEYEYFTGKDLDRMVDEACRALVRAGIEVNSRKTVALFAASDLSFVVTFFALFRLGCKVLTVSIRLNKTACLHLLGRASCDTILYGTTIRVKSTVSEIERAHPEFKFIQIPTRADFDKPEDISRPFQRHIPDKETEHTQITLMMHSSGSTGLPKPLFLSHKGLLNSMVSGTGLKAFNALPWYHLHGLITSIQAMWMRRPAHLFNAHLPLTADNLISALKSIQPEICHTVPYALKLMAERQDGIDVLKNCKVVTSAGARTPDELGNRVVKAGVRLGLIFGLTEVGHVGDSIHREAGDDSWDYIRPYANLRQHITFKKIDGNVHESVYLKSHPALMISNSNDPPGSFHSGDLFVPHPSIDWAWKYVARADDRVTLLSGEKILPLNMEGTIRESPLVRDVLMVGNDRLVPGLLAFRSTAAANLSDDEFVEAIQPYINRANEIADEFARLTPDMIAPIAADVEYPATDKNNIIRAAAYAHFEDVIENLYSKDKDVAEGNGSGNLTLNVEQLEQFILKLIRQQAAIEVPDVEADLFASGIDSLRAAQVRRLLQRNLDVGGHSLRTNIVYDAGSVAKLARLLFAMRTSEKLEDLHPSDDDEIMKMEKIIEENTDFQPRAPGALPTPEKGVVILTGATGALGAHLLNQLLDDPKVGHVYCLVRGDNALARIDESMVTRGLNTVSVDEARFRKVTALTANNLGAPNLGLSLERYAALQESATLIIHAAWPVNFNVSLMSLVPHIVGLRNLLNLSLKVPFESPAHLIFASSISTAFQMLTPAIVPEGPITSLRYAAPTGYARSKLISERICFSAAAKGAVVGVLRIGQISADTVNGIWNSKEAIPILVRSITEVHAAPRLEGDHDICDWMPVDTVAHTCLQLAEKLPMGAHEPSFYNVKPPHKFSWNEGFLPALREAGLKFEDVDLREWLSRLRSRANVLGSVAEARLPAVKLVEYYEDTYSGLGVGSGPGLRYNIEKACRDSSALRECPQVLDVGLVPKMLQHWLGDVIENK